MNLATSDGCKVCFVFCEKISGMNNERPEFLRLQKLTKNDIDVIYVWEISRLSRKAYKMLEVCEEFANKGICIISKKENIRTLDDDGKIPFKFGKVSSDFHCNHNELTSLEGSPEKVGGSFDCNCNELTSLEGAPVEVGGDFHCDAIFIDKDVMGYTKVNGDITFH